MNNHMMMTRYIALDLQGCQALELLSPWSLGYTIYPAHGCFTTQKLSNPIV